MKKIFTIIILGFAFLAGKAQINTLEYKKEIESLGCNECNLEKKMKKCFLVKSYIGTTLVTSSEKNGIKLIESTSSDEDSTHTFLFCSLEKYQEITITASKFPPITINITPRDFELGVPVIHVYNPKNNPFASEGKDIFQEMAELEDELSEDAIKAPEGFSAPGKTAEQPIYMQKRFDQNVCDYCLKEGKKYRCLMIISSLKGGKLMDGENRILHTKVLKINDSTRQSVFCLKPNEYKQYFYKARGYKNGTVEIIPQDFSNNKTPIITFYKESERKFYELEGREGSLHAEKSVERWVNSPCGDDACVYIYSSLSGLVLNDNASIIEPYEIEDFSTKIKKYTYCVSPSSKTLMVSKDKYSPCLLKLKFEELESVGGTAFAVSDNSAQLAGLSQQILNDRLKGEPVGVKATISAPHIETPKVPTGTEYRVQLVAKILDNYDSKQIQNTYNLPFEVKEDYDGLWHRFTVGSFQTPQEAEKALKDYKTKHPTLEDAFIVVYKDGKRVGLYNQ